MEHPHTHELGRVAKRLTNQILWRKALIWISLTAALCGISSISWLLWQRSTLLPPESWPLVGGFVLFITINTAAICTALLSCIETLTREHEFNRLRFDVYAAVKETLGALLSQFLPEYRRLGTAVNLGEELLKPAEHMSRRIAELEVALNKLFPELKFVEAVHLIIRQALEAQGITATVTEIERIITAITGYAEHANLAAQAGQPH